MEISHKSCRVCLSESEFNVSLFGNYCRRTNMIEKILVCLKLIIEDGDTLKTICYKCAENIERYYDFVARIKKCQLRYREPEHDRRSMELSPSHVKRHVTSYVREQVYDADYTFSFLEMPNNEEKKEAKASSPFFSYFSPPNVLVKPNEPAWKTPKPRENSPKKELLHEHRYMKRPYNPEKRSRHHSRDLFESQSQDVIEEVEPKSLDWKLTPDDNLIKRVREKCFGRTDLTNFISK